MPNVNDLKKSKFLKQADVVKPMLVTIDNYEEVNVAQEGVEPDMKWALIFKELEKPLVLNSTNGQIIASITGSGEFDEWLGAKIVLYADPNIFYGGKQVGGIRVRAPKGAPVPAPKAINTSAAAAAERQAKIQAAIRGAPAPEPEENDGGGFDEETSF